MRTGVRESINQVTLCKTELAGSFHIVKKQDRVIYTEVGIYQHTE